MIVIHIDSQKDTAFLTKCYEGIEGATILVNPKRAEVERILKENKTDRVMMLGHGSSYGLFSSDWRGDVIDSQNVHLLKDRECIGIWCYAKDFARKHGLKGYFTSMFISNGNEARWHKYDATEEEVFAEVAIFAERVNNLIKADIPLSDWVENLQSSADYNKPFVEFNYSAMEYFDGTQEPIYDYGYSAGTAFRTGTDVDTFPYEEDDDIENAFSWFEEYECDLYDPMADAYEVARQAFYAGWKAAEKKNSSE